MTLPALPLSSQTPHSKALSEAQVPPLASWASSPSHDLLRSVPTASRPIQPSILALGCGFCGEARVAALVIRGVVQADVKPPLPSIATQLHISETGTLTGSADVADLTVAGGFDGVARAKCTLRILHSARISGDLAYGALDVTGAPDMEANLRPIPKAPR